MKTLLKLRNYRAAAEYEECHKYERIDYHADRPGKRWRSLNEKECNPRNHSHKDN